LLQSNKNLLAYYDCKLLVCSVIKPNPKNGMGSKQEPVLKDSKFWSGHL